MTLEERIAQFEHLNHGRVKRDDKAYQETRELITEELERLLCKYRSSVAKHMQHRRLLRDGVDYWLRRYHNYTIMGDFRSHYRQVGLEGAGIFEHVIPLKIIRDMLIAGVLTVGEALNAPTCRISKYNDGRLRKNRRVNSTPDCWIFFTRYNVMEGIIIETHDGTVIDRPDRPEWTLENHYVHFGR